MILFFCHPEFIEDRQLLILLINASMLLPLQNMLSMTMKTF